MPKYLSTKGWGLSVYGATTLLFLYIPIIVLVLLSFNDSWTPFTWGGFSFRWYTELFRSPDIIDALKNSLTIAISSSLLSLILGLAYVISSIDTPFLDRLDLLFIGGLAIPEIVLAVGLLTMIAFLAAPQSMLLVIVAHTVLGLGYAVPILKERFIALDKRYAEASLDLGASQWQTLTRVMLPLMRPALMAVVLLTFLISLDDFILSFFLAGASVQTLPMYIFSMIRSGATPVVNALSSLLLLVSSLVIILISSLRLTIPGMFSR